MIFKKICIAMDIKKIKTPLVIRQIVKSFNAGYSPVNEICGKMRVSKTSKAFIFANWCSWLLFKKTWDWKENTIISVDQLLRKLKSSDDENIFVMDEVQRQLSRKKWYKPASQLMADLVTSQAWKHYIIFLILPKAWELGSDHASSVNYVIPCHSRSLCQPYRVETPYWDISAQKKIPMKMPLGHFSIDYFKNPVMDAFRDDLGEIIEVAGKSGKTTKEWSNIYAFKQFISVNLKEKVLDEAIEKSDKRNRREIERRGEEWASQWL